MNSVYVQTKEYKIIHPPKVQMNHKTELQKAYKILLAFSGLKHALTNNPGYNCRVSECQDAARILLEYVIFLVSFFIEAIVWWVWTSTDVLYPISAVRVVWNCFIFPLWFGCIASGWCSNLKTSSLPQMHLFINPPNHMNILWR